METRPPHPDDAAAADAALETARFYIRVNGLLSPGEPVVAAVSGGGDSMALLGILRELGHPVTVAHLDHGTRGGQSGEDAAFVADTCASWGVPCVLERTDVAREIRRGESFEAAARRIRYAFLQRVAEEREQRVATGHTEDDQAETVCMRQRRGAGARGLRGMPATRPLGSARLIRPLLSCRRTLLRAYLRHRGIPWREDPTNADPEYAARNWIRNVLFRERIEAGGDPVAEYCSLAEESRAIWELSILETARECAAFDVPAPDEAPLSVPRWGLEQMGRHTRRVWWMLWMEALGHEPTRARVDALESWLSRGRRGTAFPLGKAGLVWLGRERLVVTKGTEAPAEGGTVMLEGPEGAACPGGWRLRWRVRGITEAERRDPRAACGPYRQLLDADALALPLHVRFFRPGDRIRPIGMGGREKKLQDYFTDRGVPAPLRRGIPLVLSGEEVVWVAGLGPSETGRITPATRRVVALEAEPPAQPGRDHAGGR